MDSKTLSPQALKIIDGYLHFHIGKAVASVPYFNNKTVGAKFSERTRVGKGNPTDLTDEFRAILVKNHIDPDALTDESLKKLLVENNLGIDCSALAYYVLDAESEARGQGHVNRRMIFMTGGNPVTKMFSYLRPAQNCDVRTFKSDNNSRAIEIKDVQPGDFVTMMGGTDAGERNHILVISEVSYENGAPINIHYTHAIAYPEDGLYGTGIKQGTVSIAYPGEPLTKQVWTENGSALKAKYIFDRAMTSVTELRRLKWLS